MVYHEKNRRDLTEPPIAAIATPPGKGGVGIIRISGKDLKKISQQILKKIPIPRFAEYLPFFDSNNQIIDQGIAIFFSAPNSFTGEDVLELQGHGGPIVLDLLLKEVLQCGARMANPGEFSYRAYMNDKIDLAQAEAISDLINSSTEVAAKSAMRSLKGDFSLQIQTLLSDLINARMHVESAIDFPEEEIDFLADQVLIEKLEKLEISINKIFATAKQGCVLNEGMTIVIAGQPNAGKSSLLNRLAGYDVAIVTHHEGTTRDVLKENIQIDGMPLHIIDTAGLRNEANEIEQLGINKAWQEINKADHILYIVDDKLNFSAKDEELVSLLPDNISKTIIFNKIDISNKKASIDKQENQAKIYLSVKENVGLELLLSHLKNVIGYSGESEDVFIARRRHIDALQQAKSFIENGIAELRKNHAGELLAEDLRQAQKELNLITGEFDNEDLLGEIFSNFCIGK